MKYYSTVESAKLLGITTRAIQMRCKKSKVRKKDNKYLIDDTWIDNWRTEIQ